MTREEFIISMMLLLGRVDLMHIREAQHVFDKLDKDKTGVLDEADVVKKVEQQVGPSIPPTHPLVHPIHLLSMYE